MEFDDLCPVVLSIAGSDSSGGAGLQADLKTIHAHGAYAATVVTAITAQNTRGVQATFSLTADVVSAQLRSVFEDLHVGAVKTGMLPDAATIEVVASALREHLGPPVVVDPVLRASSGRALMEADGLEALTRELFPLATLVTPNIPEASHFYGAPLENIAHTEAAARALGEAWGCAVLIKGGHLPDDQDPIDTLFAAGEVQTFRGFRLSVTHSHGTGCCLASAIAAQLAFGATLPYAISEAKAFVARSLLHPVDIGSEPAAFDPFCGALRDPESP